MSKEVKRYEAMLLEDNPRLQNILPQGAILCGKEPVAVYLASDYEALLEENNQLRQLTSEKVMSSTILREFVARDGGVTVGLEGGACALMAQAFGQQLYESKAINYIEASFDSPEHPDMGLITVTLKRETGKTPHELRKEAEAERDALLAERDALAKDAERYQWVSSQRDAWAVIGEAYGLASEHEGATGLSEAIDAALQGEQP